MLFFRECKKIFFSLTFLIYSITVLAMYFTQFHGDAGEPVSAPVPGSDNYGMIAREVPEVLMPAAAEGLVEEYLSGSFTAYPYGFIKHVRLKEKEKIRVTEIISEISGITGEQLDSFEDFERGGYYMDENGDMFYRKPNIPEIEIPETLTYERFRDLMREVDRILGGGSRYSDDFIVGNFSLVPKTYEEALTEYEQFISEDKIAGAYARLYCDYLGIDVAILPVFVAVSLVNLDKRSRMEQLAYARKISSARLVFTRFFALIAVMLVPLIITAAIAQIRINSLYPGQSMDSFAIFRHAVPWLIPNIMTATAVGMFVTEISSGLIAIFVQGAWWFADVFTSTGGLTGGIGRFTLVMRHNSLVKHDIFYSQWENIVFNRIFFTVLSFLGIALTAFIYEQKRRGRIHGLSVQINLKNFKRQPEA